MLSTKNYNEEFIFEISPSMLTYSSDKTSYAKLQLIEIFEPHEIIQKFGSLKMEHFKDLMRKLNLSVFSFVCH